MCKLHEVMSNRMGNQEADGAIGVDDFEDNIEAFSKEIIDTTNEQVTQRVASGNNSSRITIDRYIVLVIYLYMFATRLKILQSIGMSSSPLPWFE